MGYRTGRQEEVRDYSTFAVTGSRYVDFTLGLRKDVGALRLFAAYTYSTYRLSNVIVQSFRGDILEAAETERPHAFRTLVSYDLWQLGSVGFVYRLDSGLPYARYFNSAGNYRAPVGANPGTNLNDPADDRPGRLPSSSSLNLQFRVRTRGLLGPDFHLYADLINVFGSGITSIEDPASLTPITRRSERWIRAGLEYRR